jgi:hypothetical protein
MITITEITTLIVVLIAALFRYIKLRKEQYLPWQCYWIGHNWHNYQLYPEVNAIEVKNHKVTLTKAQYQNRSCSRCDKHEQILVKKTQHNAD